MAATEATTKTSAKSWLEKYPKIFYDEPEPEDRVLQFPTLFRVISILYDCLLYTSPSPRDGLLSRMPSSA